MRGKDQGTAGINFFPGGPNVDLTNIGKSLTPSPSFLYLFRWFLLPCRATSWAGAVFARNRIALRNLRLIRDEDRCFYQALSIRSISALSLCRQPASRSLQCEVSLIHVTLLAPGTVLL